MELNTGIDPYERQLLAVFESCDRDGTGHLDSEGLVTLCQKLHLEEGQDHLMGCLLGSGPSGKTVFTFSEFRDALLALLGAGRRQSEDEREPSPEREVSPKFVFGQKKYGRRSRPESTDQESGGQDENIDDTDCDTFLPIDNDEKDLKSNSSCRILIGENKTKGVGAATPDTVSSIAVEAEGIESCQGQGEAEIRAAAIKLGVSSGGYLDKSKLASVCQDLGMEKIADEVVKQVFAKLDMNGVGSVSFEEFLQLFRSGSPPSLSHPLSPPPQSFYQHNINSLEIMPSGYVSTENIIELWEFAGIRDASRLLNDLGLTGMSEISLALLSSVLDEEIRNLRTESGKQSLLYTDITYLASLLTAALTLAHVQLKHSRTSLEQMTCERDKLKTDLTEANQRASLLAQEVDDRHARMERASQMQIKLIEQRHSDQVKQLSLQLAADREQLAAATQRLGKKLSQQQEEEARVHASLLSLQKEYEIMEKENRNLSERLSQCEAAKAKAEKEIATVETLQQRVTELESNNDQVASLIEKLSQLQAENTSLRDRNDELSIKVENLSRTTQKKPGCSTSLEGCIGGGTKRRGNSPLGSPPDVWDDDSPRLGKVRRCCTENDLSLDNVHMEGLAIRPLHHSESGLEADLDTLDNSLTLSNNSDKISFRLGSENSILFDELERLRARNAELERTVQQFENKGVFSVINRHPSEELSGDTTLPALCTEIEVQTSFENPKEVIKLEKYCHELKTTLEKVKEEIVKILSEKRECTEENCLLKQRVEDLMKRLQNLSSVKTKSFESPNFNDGVLWESEHTVSENLKSLEMQTNLSDSSLEHSSVMCFPFINKDVKLSETNTLFPVDKPKMDLKFQNLSHFAFDFSQRELKRDFYSENIDYSVLENKPLPLCLNFDNEEHNVFENKDVEKKVCVNKLTDQKSITIIDKERQSEYVTVVSECKKLKDENKKLLEKCNELETSLELMQVEYEKCEDYWQCKLNEERAIFDQEQRLNDEKFTDLELKIQEYAEMFGSEQQKQDGRLPTIDEREMLEKQVTDLEEEFLAFRKTSEKEAEIREREMSHLQSEINSLLQSSADRNPERKDVAVQKVSSSSNTSKGVNKTGAPDIELAAQDDVECCCLCHKTLQKEMSRGIFKLRDFRFKLQSECDILMQRRDVIVRQLSVLQHRNNLMYPPAERTNIQLFHNLSSRLRQQELTCRHLQSALKHQQRQTEQVLQNCWEHHHADLTEVQNTLKITKDKLQQHIKTNKEQMEHLAMSDILVKELYVENAHLVATVQKLEQRCHYLTEKTSNFSSL